MAAPALALIHHSPVAAAYSSLRSSCVNRRRQGPLLMFGSSHSSWFFNKHHPKSKSCINKSLPISCGTVKPCSAPVDQLENETMRLARKAFSEEVIRSDENISLAKAALLISVEDEAFVLANRERDLAALQREGRRDLSLPNTVYPTDALLLEGQSISHWLDELDSLAKPDQQQQQHPLEALKTFTRKSSLTTDPRSFYLHHVLTLGAGTAIMLGILYMELCRRRGTPVCGAPVGDDFLVWPSTEKKVMNGGETMEAGLSAEMVFEPFKGGKIWSRESDGSYARHIDAANVAHVGPHPTSSLRPASNRAILSALLRKLKRLYWKRAAKAYAGSEIAAPLHPFALATAGAAGPVLSLSKEQTLLRPQDLRLAVAASEKLLLLQRGDWITRRDHGLLLYHSRRYGEAVQELSTCLAIAPVHELQVLEPFLEKIHLLRVESSWAGFNH